MDLLISMIAGGCLACTALGRRSSGRFALGFWLTVALGTLGGLMAGFVQRRFGLGGLNQTAADNASLDPVALLSQITLGGLGGLAFLAVLGLLTGRIGR